jgi:hypothetical protein
MNNAGYMPDKIPTIKGVTNNGINIGHFIKIESDNCCPEILLSHGSVKYKRINAIRIDANDIKTDSLRN